MLNLVLLLLQLLLLPLCTTVVDDNNIDVPWGHVGTDMSLQSLLWIHLPLRTPRSSSKEQAEARPSRGHGTIRPVEYLPTVVREGDVCYFVIASQHGGGR